MAKMIPFRLACFFLLFLTEQWVEGFVGKTALTNRQPVLKSPVASYRREPRHRPQPYHPARMFPSSIVLKMYNLPPSPGNDPDWKSVLNTALVVVGVVAFFASPLGGLVFAFFNSLLVLSIVLPLLGVVGFQIWQSFNTISGACPNCGAPVRVMKQSGMQLPDPSICFNCGTIVQATPDNEGIELAATFDQSPGSGMFWDSFFSGSPTPRGPMTGDGANTNPVRNRTRRERTVIDVEVEDD